VVLFERDRFPRFHLGESLLPYSVPILERTGVWQRLLDYGFRHKYGGDLVFEPSGQRVSIDFSEGIEPEYDMAIQVRRAEFDQILLQNAAEKGVEVHEEAPVERIRFEESRATGVDVRLDGQTIRINSQVVIDASGRDTLVGSQLGTRRRDETLRQVALFAPHSGAIMDIGRDGGNLLLAGGPFGWFWMIPTDDVQTSVGIVCPSSTLQRRKGRSLDELFDELVASSPEVSRRLANATRLRPVEPTADFSYQLERFGGDGYIVLGDAAAFLDPVFSSGIHLALDAAERAAKTITKALSRRGRLDDRDVQSYERQVRRGLTRFRRYILGYYDPGFGSLFSSDSPPALLYPPIVTIIAGKVHNWGPRLWLTDKILFVQAHRYRRAMERGQIEQFIAPAHQSG
jgi:flavin-dependent dehydrogenase